MVTGSATMPHPTGPTEGGGPVRVLLVDDTDVVRASLRRHLERNSGIVVIGEVSDGQAAIAEAESLQPDVIVLDISMPTLDGLSALPSLRRVIGSGRIVVFSGFEASMMAEAAVAAGADQYIEKGSPVAELVAAITAPRT